MTAIIDQQMQNAAASELLPSDKVVTLPEHRAFFEECALERQRIMDADMGAKRVVEDA